MSSDELTREARRLLELHDELDRLSEASDFRSPLWIVVWIVALAAMIRIFFMAREMGLGLEFGAVLVAGTVGVSVPWVLQRRRIRMLRRRIDAIEGGGPVDGGEP